MSKNIGFDTFPTEKESSLYEIVFIGGQRLFCSAYQSSNQEFRIISPGLVNLLGERFVVLRCKEIEDHLLGSLAYASSMNGIGIFKLAALYNDITHLRFDFVNVVKKPFHPIGKLTRLTFRFETAAGQLYDFKGVNVQMLILIKYLVPSQKYTFEKSILNPNYDGNFMKYMATHKNMEHNEESEEEVEYDDKEHYLKYKKELERYDYSTSEEEESDSDDSEEEVPRF